MPSIQRMLLAIRSLLEDDPPLPRKKRRNNTNSILNGHSRQAVALVVTFRDLFASGNLNLILEDIEKTNRKSPNRKDSHHSSKTHHLIGQPTATSSPIIARISPDTSSRNGDLVPASPTVLPLVLNNIEETVPLLHDERIISCPQVDFRNIDPLLARTLAGSQTRELVPYTKSAQGTKSKNFTVSLSPDDEKETVAVLRKVLKWSPRKQNIVSFKVPLPKEEEHKAVAVVQNAVNRVKEENFKKKKRKWKFFKLTFC